MAHPAVLSGRTPAPIGSIQFGAINHSPCQEAGASLVRMHEVIGVVAGTHVSRVAVGAGGTQ
jgi:hypothetical protein